MSLSISSNRCTYLWGPCPCGHDLRPCTCVQGPKNPPRNSSNIGAKTLSMSCNCLETDTPTGMSTTLSKYCLGPHVDDLTGHRPPVVAHQRACNNLSRPPRTATVGARLSPPRQHSRDGPAQQGHRPPCQRTATGESLEDQGNLHLRHDRDVVDVMSVTVVRMTVARQSLNRAYSVSHPRTAALEANKHGCT